MEAGGLAEQLEARRSIESIARETDLHPSTVAYWVSKHGLQSQHAARHASKGGIAREVLETLVASGLSGREIGAELGVSQATVRHWLLRHGLVTERAKRRRAIDGELSETGGARPQSALGMGAPGSGAEPMVAGAASSAAPKPSRRGAARSRPRSSTRLAAHVSSAVMRAVAQPCISIMSIRARRSSTSHTTA